MNTKHEGRVSHTKGALQKDYPEDPEVRRRGRQEKAPPLVHRGCWNATERWRPRDGVDR